MTNTDVVLAAIRQRPGATDGELRVLTGVEPHQQVNQICRRLAQQGVTERRPRQDGLLGNIPLGSAPGSSVEHPPTRRTRRTWRFEDPGGTRAELPSSSSQGVSLLPPPRSALILTPCFGEKDIGGRPASDGAPSIAGLLSPGIASQLLDARSPVLRLASHDPWSAPPSGRPLPRPPRDVHEFTRASCTGSTFRLPGFTPLIAQVQNFGVLRGGWALIARGFESPANYGAPLRMATDRAAASWSRSASSGSPRSTSCCIGR